MYDKPQSDDVWTQPLPQILTHAPFPEHEKFKPDNEEPTKEPKAGTGVQISCQPNGR